VMSRLAVYKIFVGLEGSEAKEIERSGRRH
jgi:hypothetical protein